MPTVEYKGKVFEVDEDGFLQAGLDGWCKEWVEYVKEQEGIQELTEEHWKVINVLQDYYRKNGVAPMVRVLTGTQTIMKYYNNTIITNRF